MKAQNLAFALAVAGAALLVWSNEAQAAGHASGFGDKGDLILSADRLVPLFGYTHSSINDPNNANISTSQNGSSISLLFGRDLSSADGLIIDVHAIPRVAFDIAIIDHLTLGAGIAFAFGLGGTRTTQAQNGATVVTTSTDSPTGTAIGLAPRIGYIIPLGEHLAIWPRLGFAFYSLSTTSQNNIANVNATTKATDTTFSLDLDPQLAIIPTEHFFFTIGPLASIPISGSRSTSTTSGANTTTTSVDTTLFHFAINASIGGWVNVF